MESVTSILRFSLEASRFASLTLRLVKSGTSMVLLWLVIVLSKSELTSMRTVKNVTARMMFLRIHFPVELFLSDLPSIMFMCYFPPLKKRSNAPSPISASPTMMMMMPAILFIHMIFLMSNAFLHLLKNHEKKSQ